MKGITRSALPATLAGLKGKVGKVEGAIDQLLSAPAQ
jgi:hypothetical protein